MKNNINISSLVLKNKLTAFIKNYTHKAVFALLIVYFIYTSYFLYQFLYLPLSGNQKVDPNIIQSKKEVINQGLYNTISKKIDDKLNAAGESRFLRDPFTRNSQQ